MLEANIEYRFRMIENLHGAFFWMQEYLAASDDRSTAGDNKLGKLFKRHCIGNRNRYPGTTWNSLCCDLIWVSPYILLTRLERKDIITFPDLKMGWDCIWPSAIHSNNRQPI